MSLSIFLIKFMAFFLGCSSSFFLKEYFSLDAVVASAMVGLLGTMMPLPSGLNASNIRAIIYCGSFAGMCSAEVLPKYEYILLLSVIGAGLFLLSKSYFNGIGGKLGSIAFISSLSLMMLKAFV